MNDLISRKALCDYALNQKDKSVTPNDIMRFPSAQPEQKRGKWVDGWSSGFDGMRHWFRECSVCGYGRDDDNPENDTNFCPDCGADMRGEGHE